MAPERAVRPIWIVAGLMLGFAVVLAGPAWLVWDWFRPAPWDESTLRAEFQSVRYESGGLVFRYSVRNLTRRVAQFEPTLTEIHALQAKDRPLVGYPNVLLPFDVEAHSSHVLEVRLELPSGSAALDAGPSFGGQPTMSSTPEGGSVGETPDEALTDLDGFELVDAIHGMRLLLPRAW